MEPYAFALPVNLLFIQGSATTFMLCFLVVASDGVNTPLYFQENFVYDATQAAATNISNVKAQIVSGAAQQGLTVLTSNVLVFTTVS